MTSYAYYLAYVQAGLGELKDYLLTKELFWQISLNHAPGEPTYPKLTIGNLLYFLQCAKGLATDIRQESEVARLGSKLDALTTQWRTAWEEKAGREFSSRLRQWSQYLSDARGEGGAQKAYYANEVRLRVKLGLLLEALPEAGSNEQNQLAALDDQIRAKFVPGEFVWQEDLSRAFPQEKYWYLYGGLK